jgi:predicted  nucleic acid-binding Zn-ribbon protein
MGKLEALWNYQAADMEYDKCEQALRQSPNYKRYAKVHKYLADQRRILQNMTDAVDSRRSQIDLTQQHLDLLLKRYEDGIAKFEAVDKTNLSEVERFRKYFEQLHARLAQERREFQELAGALEKEDAQLNDMRVKLSRARKEYDELKAVLAQERAEKQQELDTLQKAAEEAAKSVEPAVLEKYKASKRSHSMPVAKVLGNKCGGCNMELPAVLSRKLKEGTEIVECDNCGRILYLE